MYLAGTVKIVAASVTAAFTKGFWIAEAEGWREAFHCDFPCLSSGLCCPFQNEAGSSTFRYHSV